jgi:hypothetical protein
MVRKNKEEEREEKAHGSGDCICKGVAMEQNGISHNRGKYDYLLDMVSGEKRTQLPCIDRHGSWGLLDSR